MTGYDIDNLEPGASGGGGGGSTDNGAMANNVEVVDDLSIAATSIGGWSLQNTNAGLSTVYIRFGSTDAADPFIAINLAEDETVTQVLDTAITNAGGFFVTVEAGTVDGLIYTS